MTSAIAEKIGISVCTVQDLEVERGRAAILGSEQVALFLLADGSVHAVSNLDPYSGANVISRGIVGSKGDAPTIASPLHKQIFDLRTGECLETQGKATLRLAVWQVCRYGDDIHLLPPASVLSESAAA